VAAPAWLPSALAAPLAVAGGLLLVTGLAKARDPLPVGQALRAAIAPPAAALALPLAAAEIAAGCAAIVLPGRPSALAVGALYLAFGAFLVRALALEVPLRSCGCAGARETPPSPLHLALALGLAALALTAAAVPPPPLAETLSGAPLGGAPLGAGVAAAVLLTHEALVHAPGAFSSYRPGRGGA
jgi:hypothetical protein